MYAQQRSSSSSSNKSYNIFPNHSHDDVKQYRHSCVSLVLCKSRTIFLSFAGDLLILIIFLIMDAISFLKTAETEWNRCDIIPLNYEPKQKKKKKKKWWQIKYVTSKNIVPKLSMKITSPSKKYTQRYRKMKNALQNRFIDPVQTGM